MSPPMARATLQRVTFFVKSATNPHICQHESIHMADPTDNQGNPQQSDSEATDPAAHRIIKRYANRKLYDTQRSRYVTLDQIADMIRAGEDVRIIDNNSKDDLTSVTLAQILFEEEKKQRSFLSLKAMRTIIQSGGARFEELVNQAKKNVDQATHKVSHVFQRGQGPDAQAPSTEAALSQGAPQTETEPERERRMIRELREWVDTSQRTIDDWRRKMDDRLQTLQHNITITPLTALKKELTQLTNRIGELEERLKQNNTRPGE